MSTPHDILCEELRDASLWLDEPSDMARYTTDWTRKHSGPTPLVLRPRTTEEVAQVLAACNRHGIALVPQGGNTGMVGGGVPRNGEVIVSLERMRAIGAFDAASATVEVEAGVVLATLQEFLESHSFELAVDLGARGSCQIGGMLATNAGGIRVLRYGHMREQLRGIEVVLADGTVVSSLNKLKKNNTGFDLKQVFVGSEGTLGIITRAVLQVEPQPLARQTALATVPTLSDLPALFEKTRALCRGLSSLEFLTADTVAFVLEADPAFKLPIGETGGAYIIIEEETDAGEAAREAFTERLGALMETGLITDAVVAATEAQARAIWAVREAPTETISRVGLTHKFDVTVPPGAMAPFLGEMAALAETTGGVRALLFGHLGDGNVHVNMAQRPGTPDETFRALGEPLAAEIYGIVSGHAGSISAEHGIGIMKREYLHLSRNAEEIALMRRLKGALDPNGILNPGVILDA